MHGPMNVKFMWKAFINKIQRYVRHNGNKRLRDLDDWLTVHRSITLVNFQLAQNSYLFMHNTFIKILYMFRALPCSSTGGLRRNCIYEAFFLNRCTGLSHAESDNTRGCIYIYIYIYIYIHTHNNGVDLLKMSREMFETCRGF